MAAYYSPPLTATAHQIQNDVWYNWHSTQIQNDVWYNWRSMATTESATTTIYYEQDVVWQTWTATGSNSVTAIPYNTVVWRAWEHQYATEEERRADQERHRLAQADLEQRRREDANRRRLAREQEEQRLEAAEARARELLETILTPDEAGSGDGTYIQIVGSDGYIYRIRMDYGVHGNITRLDEHGCRLGTVCVAPRMRDEETGRVLPTTDGIVGQVLGLKFDAEVFLSHGNWSYVRGCQLGELTAVDRAPLAEEIMEAIDEARDIVEEDRRLRGDALRAALAA